MENVRKHRNIKPLTTERRINYLVSKPKYHTTNFFTGNSLAKKMGKYIDEYINIVMNKPVYLGLSIFHLSKIVMYEFWYDYVRPNYDENGYFVIWIWTASLLI